MAADQASLPINGNFIPAQHQAFELGMQSNGAHSANNSISATAPDYTNASSQPQEGNDLSKDEVGWYFVEQYYTTMSKSPEKLYLFYNKRSQFVSGSETERLDVCVGQKAINERIKDLDIQDCKVRVTNVDAQGSGQNIVIQVIGEMSTKKQPQRKFTQTFVLAEQTNGYFVLNDIFRYIVDDDEDIEGEELQRGHNEVATGYQEPTATAVAEPEPHTLTNSQDASAREHDAQLVDQGLQEAAHQGEVATEPAPAGAINGEPAPKPEQMLPAEDTTAAATIADGEAATKTVPETVEAVAEEEIKQPEKPAAPEPTPAPSPPKQKPAQPAPAPAPVPAVPKTWASMAASANKGKAAPAPQNQNQSQNQSQSQLQPQSQAPTAPAASKPAPNVQPQAVPAPGAQDPEQPATPQSSGSEWQTAARDHGKKQARPQSGAAPPDNSRAYMKNVGDNITVEMIRNALSQYGELTYCDINRQKSCAFADFATPAAYQAAVSANPHEIGGERIVVEERRIRPQSFGGFGQRGGMGPRGRGNFPKDGGRGNFGQRGRGNAPRGRGVSQAA